MLHVVTKDGRLTRTTADIIRTYENMGVDVKKTLTKALKDLEQQRLTEMLFGEELKIVNGTIQTTKDRIEALKAILAAL